MSEAVNQTSFSQNQEILQAPPVVEISEEEKLKLAEKAKKQKQKLYLGLGTVGMMLVLTVLLSVLMKPGAQKKLPDINFPNTSGRQTSNWQQRILDLKNRLKEYDPTDIELAPPPVDYKISLEADNNY
ncbi:MAG: hypothetical protein ACD_83C00080G0005 [uncultured bacterium]|nr:MAG: hypothetical protein ACD_83C00080G0005 [uncultured bacterium]